MPKASTLSAVFIQMDNSAYLIYRLPGGDMVERYGASIVDDSSVNFHQEAIMPWLGACFSEEQPMQPALKSTPPADYHEKVSKLIAKLKKDGGKTVVARQICGTFNNFEPRKMAMEYFSMFPDMLCFLFYHPATGYWMGATPELLLRQDGDNIYYTQALAGTRLRSKDSEPWSAKNIEEHAIVVDEICRRANALEHCTATAESCYNFAYGNIEHLCTPIKIEIDSDCKNESDVVVDLVDALHPTPAVGGFPREKAFTNIQNAESFQRKFYGGLINIFSTGNYNSYVILRCVHFDAKNWCVYTGSGITAASDADDEWAETDAKAAPLINLLKKY